jgi:hypothetical protein
MCQCTRGHAKETGTQIHLKVKTHHYFNCDGDADDVNNNNDDDGGIDDDDDDDNNNNNNNNRDREG